MTNTSLLSLVFCALMVGNAARAQTGLFTAQVGALPGGPESLVRPADIWMYHKGSAAPQAGWRTISDATLDDTWTAAPGGFGYSNDWAPETNNCRTILTDMQNGYDTLYIRRTFHVTNAVDAARRLLLTMDWDDGFVAYLDGVELARFNAPGSVGTEPANTAAATTSHEASTGNPDNSPQPAVTYDLGAVGDRLAPGPHVLAVLGLNRANGSTDFVLVPELSLSGEATGVINNGLYVLSETNVVTVTGSNTVAGSTRVTINGDDAALDPGNGVWSAERTLAPGFNRLYIAAHDATGQILTNLIRDVVFRKSGVSLGGAIGTDAFWTNREEVVHITNSVVVGNGARLTIGAGVVVMLSPGLSLTSSTNSAIETTGVDEDPAYFLPATPVAWGGVTASGTNSELTLRHAEVVAGQVRVLNRGTLLMEDMTVRDLPDGSREVIEAVNGASLVMRRVYMTRFTEGDSQDTPVLVEDCLLEGFLADGMDIKATNAPLVVRRSTLRNADPNNNNADGIDFGPGPGYVERCLIYNFPDKGVSIGGASGTIIRDSVIFNCGIGISAYSSSNCVFFNTTVASCDNGLLLRNNPDPAFATATNLIVWGNVNNVVVTNTSALELVYSAVEGGFPGEGNIATDPLFVDAASHDYRLAAGSPAIGTGSGDQDMGAVFPVGGIPSQPANLAALNTLTNAIRLTWIDTADNEEGTFVQRSTDGRSWQVIGQVGPGETSFEDETALLEQNYYYRVRATNSSGHSAFSNPARGKIGVPATIVGGTLLTDTTWSGVVLVGSNVFVPTNVTLTISPGTLVRLTNNASIMAQTGGVIRVEGTAEQNAVLERWNGTNNWGELRAEGAGAYLIVRHADISGGQTTIYNGAVGLLEDSYFHGFYQQGAPTIFNQPLVLTHFAGPTTMRRCYLRDYHETLWRHGVTVIEDCVFEDTVGDALDFDAARPGSIIRRSTFRHGVRGNVDAIDIGNDGPATSSGVIIESCLMYDFPFDKGISIGEGSTNTVVTNCFIYSCNWGIGVKDTSTAAFFNNTVVNCDIGFRLYNKIAGAGSGIVTESFNNILWGNTNGSIAVLDGGSIEVTYSDLFETNWPGQGNISADPIFLNVNGRDYRLAKNSPAGGAGRNGEDMGAHFPVGSVMAPSHPSIQSIVIGAAVAAVDFWADSERTYTVECSEALEGAPWIRLADVPASSRPKRMTVTNSIAPGSRFYRLVTPARP